MHGTEGMVRTMTIEQAIEHAEDTAISAIGCECREEHRQLAAWLRELQERRKAPEIVRCGECAHYIPILSNWGKCGVHCSPTEKYRTCQICDYCSWAEKREEKSKWAKNPYVQCR